MRLGLAIGELLQLEFILLKRRGVDVFLVFGREEGFGVLFVVGGFLGRVKRGAVGKAVGEDAGVVGFGLSFANEFLVVDVEVLS